MDSNPLIRALAIRTMSYIGADKIVSSFTEPLRRCIKDKDPYVRKTAAVCIAKLYFNNRDLVIEEGFIESLKSLLTDSNPTVNVCF
jgi:AP-2 complex subunit beta-1